MAGIHNRWWFWHPYSDWNVKRRGRRDAIQSPPIPPWGAREQPPFLMELKQAGDNDIRIVARGWTTRDRSLKAAWLRARQMHQKALALLDSSRETLDRACEHYREVHGVPPPAGSDLRFLGYKLTILALLIAEFPMNSVVFRLFGENEVLTYLVTAAIAGALLFCAHFLGAILREGRFSDKRNVWAIGALIATPALAIAGVAYFRQFYLAHLGEDTRGLNPTAVWAAFAVFNLVIFVVAFVYAYWIHDEALVAVYRARKQHAAAQKAHTVAEQRLAQTHTVRAKRWEACREAAYQIRDIVQRLSEIYRTHNLQHRDDRGQSHDTDYPHSFYEYVGVTIPPSLDTLEWSATAVDGDSPPGVPPDGERPPAMPDGARAEPAPREAARYER